MLSLPYSGARVERGFGVCHRHCVRAVKEMDSKSIGLCPQGFESPRCRFWKFRRASVACLVCPRACIAVAATAARHARCQCYRLSEGVVFKFSRAEISPFHSRFAKARLLVFGFYFCASGSRRSIIHLARIELATFSV